MNITKIVMSSLILILQVQDVDAQDNSNNNYKTNDLAVKITETDQSVIIKPPISNVKKKSIVIKWPQVAKIPGLIAAGKLKPEEIPDPHWKADACLACHKRDAGKATSANLRKKNVGGLCVICHDVKFDHSYIHPVNIKLDKKMKRHIKPELKDSLLKTGGKITCSTCHDLTIQCLPKYKKQEFRNPSFFRGGPFETRTVQCYFCHDETQYQRLNPHDQIDDAGKIKQNICRTCHAGSIRKLLKATSVEDVSFHAEDDLSSLCWGCHRLSPHPGGQYTFFSTNNPKPGPDHLVKPSVKTLNIMKRTTAKNDIEFPLEPGSGRVHCGTCHNSHEKGVIKNKALATGADEDKRLRAQQMCNYCHDM